MTIAGDHLDMTSNQRLVAGKATRARLAATDIVQGASNWPLWWVLAWNDIRQRYRRSVLGPLWITLTMMATIAGMGPLYAILLKIDARDFIPYLALGLVSWGLVSSIILDGCSTFTGAESIIRSVRLPLSIHAFRMIARNIVIFLHNMLAYVPVAIYLGIHPTWLWLMAVPGLLMIILAAVPVAIILGIFCARFRDMQQIVASIVQLAFFLTPILWKPELLGERAAIVNFNPFYLFVDMLRGPVYGHIPGAKVYMGAGLVILVLYSIAVPLFSRYRQRIAFWV